MQKSSLHMLPEQIDRERYILPTFFIELSPDQDIIGFTETLAIDMSTGTWTPVEGETEKMREKYGAKVVSINEVPGYESSLPPGITERRYVASFAIPYDNIGSQIPMLLTTIIGNTSVMGKIKLLDIEFPPEGPINSLLKLIKLDFLALAWLGDPRTVLWTVIFVVLWSFNGLGVITYLAGFATISEDLFDAAAIDGASFWGKFFHITLPIMRPIIGYWAVLCTGGMLLWMFPFIFALTQGGPGYSSMMPEYLVYMVSFRFFERGYGTAIGVALFIVVLLFTFFQVKYMYGVGNVSRKKG